MGWVEGTRVEICPHPKLNRAGPLAKLGQSSLLFCEVDEEETLVAIPVPNRKGQALS